MQRAAQDKRSVRLISEPMEELRTVTDGRIAALDIIEEHCTTVYKIQEAFSALSLPEGNIYGNAIRRCLYG